MCAAAAVLVLTGCAAPVEEPAEPPPYPGNELRPRPRDIDVREIDPCSLLTEQQRAELALETPPLFTPRESSVFFEGPTAVCTSIAFRPLAFDVAVELTWDGRGIGALTGRPVNGELTALDLEGFPAVLGRPEDQTFCQVIVDLAPGSGLSLQYREGGRGTIPQEDLCEGVQQVAERAMSTLVSST